MAGTPVEILVDLPTGVVIREYERIDDGHAFHVGWEFPAQCRCETCKQERPLNLVEKAKFLTIRASDAERHAYRQAAERAGKPLSEWIRERLNRAAKR